MRRNNPFESGERNNFPTLSPLKPANKLSYGSDSLSEDDYDDDDDGQVFADDFEDDEDIDIDAGGSESDGERRGGKETGKEKNINLDWSIDTLSTLKPTEVS